MLLFQAGYSEIIQPRYRMIMIRRKKRNCLLIGGMLLVAAVICLYMIKDSKLKIETESVVFTESSKELRNPGRGFYSLYSFQITDEKTDYDKLAAEMYHNDTDTTLTLVQICLQSYRESEISDAGLANIENLFRALDLIDKQLIVRFVYDVDGENEQYEPERLDIILGHMEQLKDVLSRHSKQIFILQGLFTGNWGEMNGTRYDSDEELCELAEKLAEITDEAIYLAVRTPAQWRCITQMEYRLEASISAHAFAGRLGLFNDGMLGNESDYGTYASGTDMEYQNYPKWSREAELEFQEELCRKTPNGGEVIKDNVYNDFEYALQDLKTMHVTYLNKDYDQEVLNKWARSVAAEKGCFDGMDGYTYIERHLGYRLLITEAELKADEESERLAADITLKNIGFAPIYKEPKLRVVFYNEKEPKLLSSEVSGLVCELTGGNETEKTVVLHADIAADELGKGEYKVYFSIVDSDTEAHIQLANEQEEEQYGYCIGTVEVQ